LHLALRIVGIPTSVIKTSIAVLASPIAHLVNKLLSTGIVLAGFKEAIIHLVHKGLGKSRTPPSSYRPVSIMPALQGAGDDFKGRLGVPPVALLSSQHGF
jgi:hypothetical protein